MIFRGGYKKRPVASTINIRPSELFLGQFHVVVEDEVIHRALVESQRGSGHGSELLSAVQRRSERGATVPALGQRRRPVLRGRRGTTQTGSPFSLIFLIESNPNQVTEYRKDLEVVEVNNAG